MSPPMLPIALHLNIFQVSFEVWSTIVQCPLNLRIIGKWVVDNRHRTIISQCLTKYWSIVGRYTTSDDHQWWAMQYTLAKHCRMIDEDCPMSGRKSVPHQSTVFPLESLVVWSSAGLCTASVRCLLLWHRTIWPMRTDVGTPLTPPIYSHRPGNVTKA
jgi:hypothetical protein